MEKIAIINSVIDYGSTGSLTRSLFEYGKRQGYEPFVFYGRGKENYDDHLLRIDCTIEVYIHKVLSLLTGKQGFYSNNATNKLLRCLHNGSFKKVILLNLHGYYINEARLLSFLKNNRVITAYVTPDEYAGLGKCCYSLNCDQYKTECKNCPHINDYPKSFLFDRSNDIFKMKKNVYNGFNTLTLLGPESNLIKFRESALVKDKPMKRISWGIDLDLYKYEVVEGLYEKYKIPKNKILILTVASYSNLRKGVKEYFFEVAKRLQHTEYHFINVGYDGNLRPDEIPCNMTTIAYIHDQKELANLYALSDLYLLASKTDTMPISCLIAFGCETPVCCFYTSGLRYLAPVDSLAIKYCYDISVNSLLKVVTKVHKKTLEERIACRELAKTEYSVEAFCKKVYEVFDVEE